MTDDVPARLDHREFRPRFNWGAFLMPPVWGVAHGMWTGLFFIPLWVFADNVIRSSVGYPGWMRALAWATAAATLAFQYVFARSADAVAWRRASASIPLEAYRRRQRAWAMVSGGILVMAVAWIGAFSLR